MTSTRRHPLRLALIQFRPDKGRVDENLTRLRDHLEQSRHHDLVVFPETALTGYFVEGGVVEGARTTAEVAAALGPAGDDAPDAVVGYYERWRQGLFNSVGYFEATPGGYRPLHVHRKLFLPTYGLFDESRFVNPGRALKAVDTRFGRIGLLVCEDVWHTLPATTLAVAGAELIVVVGAAPARDFTQRATGTLPGEADSRGEVAPGSLARWHRLARSTAEEHGVFVAVCQLVGSEGGKLLSGGSVVVDPAGTRLAAGPVFEEGRIEADLHGVAVGRARAGSPLLADLEDRLPWLQRALDDALRGDGAVLPGAAPEAPPVDSFPAGGLEGRRPGRPATPVAPRDPALLELDLELVEAALVHFIRQEVRVRRGFEQVVVGVSGGVDSAVALTLACRALGAENVHGFRLPHTVSSPDSLEHAALVLERTGAHARTIDISPAVDGYLAVHEEGADGLRAGNVMARMRALVLFDQSAKLGALPLGTGNKSERLLGYYTWHADDSPPINPLGDLFKTQVWALARHLGVPDEIVAKPASADLVKGVHDEDELGIGYHAADPILYWLVRGYPPEDLVESGFPEDEVGVVHRRLSGTHWKRELPTVALLSSTAIGEFYLRPVDY
jgi:NAD+ synthetase